MSDANDTTTTTAASLWLWLAGLGGALVSLAHMQNLNRWQKAGAVVAGTLTAGFLGPYVAEYIAVNAHGSAAVHFLLGLCGLILTSGLVSIAKGFRENPAATLGEVLKRIGSKPT